MKKKESYLIIYNTILNNICKMLIDGEYMQRELLEEAKGELDVLYENDDIGPFVYTTILSLLMDTIRKLA